jgi:[protein-PII] uridylyltransferase
MKSVGPKVWNAWKGSLLDELYRRTLERLETGEAIEEGREARLARRKEQLASLLSSFGAVEQVAEFLEAMPDSYLLSTPEESVPRHLQLVQRFVRDRDANEGELYRTSLVHFPEREFSELTIVTQDRPGLFAMLTGVLAMHALNVVSARISTSREGVAVDVFRLSHLDRRNAVLDQDTWTRVYARLGAVLRGERTLEEMLRAVQSPSYLARRNARILTEVTVDNDSSPDYSLIDVTAPDRMGFLFCVTYALFQLDLRIHLAKITTNVDQVLDVFYVTDRDGRKVADPKALAAALRERLSVSDS